MMAGTKGVIGLVLLLAVVGALVLVISSGWTPIESPQLVARSLVLSLDTPANPSDSQTRTFVVRRGESTSEIATRLQDEGLIERGLVFRALAEMEGISGELAAGEYELSPSMRPSEILFTMAGGKTRIGPLLTIPEGWRAEEIAERVSGRGIGSSQEFMEVVLRGRMDLPSLASRPAGAGLEGYLFPESYRLDAKTTTASMVARMAGEFDRRFTPEMRAQAASLGITVHQAVTMASIVEREAVKPSERSIIAGVFYNRLREGMKLETDPTVQYAIAMMSPESQQKYGWWKKELSREDLSIDSPYNSYKYPGLPPGPICNPGLDSLKAALEPADTDYLFFVARPDGSHAFSKTLEEHNANVSQYRR